MNDVRDAVSCKNLRHEYVSRCLRVLRFDRKRLTPVREEINNDQDERVFSSSYW